MGAEETIATRRSALSQERSRRTRRRLVRAALGLWAERGFARGIEDTTALEIAEAAGVSKGTFYLHFARKEDILHEMASAAATAFEDSAETAVARLLPMRQILDAAHNTLAKRVEGTGRAAVARSLAEEKRRSILTDCDNPSRFGQTYERILKYGQDCGELSSSCNRRELADMLEALTMDAMERWARNSVPRLRPILSRRTAFILDACSASGDQLS
jgi:AcrR family transcriptional regulator